MKKDCINKDCVKDKLDCVSEVHNKVTSWKGVRRVCTCVLCKTNIKPENRLK